MSPQPAFMASAPLPATLSAGISAVCGASVQRCEAARGRATVTMTGSPGITLQTLVNAPNPTISCYGDLDLICTRVYKQVFGNAYVMESERAEMYKAESMYRAGMTSLREFVRACALSETYRRRFFSCCGPYRAVELNFKHLLGRGPNSQQEVSEHVQRTINEGYEADINSFIDSEEYELKFGEEEVPGIVFKGTYSPIEEFNRMCSLYSSPGTTDKSLTGRAAALGIDNANQVLSLEGAGISSKVVSLAAASPTAFTRVKRAIPSRPDLEHGVDVGAGLIQPAPTVVNEDAAPRTRVEIAPGSYMFLTSDEAAEYKKQSMDMILDESLMKSEQEAVQDEIARLEARIAELAGLA